MMCHSVPSCMHFLSPYVTHNGVTGCMPFLQVLYNGIHTQPFETIRYMPTPLKQYVEYWTHFCMSSMPWCVAV